MLVADILVSNSIRHASTLGSYRVGDVHGLYRRPFSLPQNRDRFAKGAVRFSSYLCARADLGQAAPDSVCPICSPAS